jgi:hypothetical protein
LQHGFFLIFFADKPPGVDIDRGQGFGMIDNNMPA